MPNVIDPWKQVISLVAQFNPPASVAREVDVSTRLRLVENGHLVAVRNVRGELKNEGLVKAFPEKDESGVILRRLIARTQAPRT